MAVVAVKNVKNVYGNHISLFPFQREIVEKIKGGDGIVLAPTGSGKTPIAYEWAFRGGQHERTIFTAPIKALSNERYDELVKNFGAGNVGINTGDIKKNTDAPIIACTQEIYTSVYAHRPHQAVIIDEIHYIFQNKDRARAYVDGIRKTPPDSRILLLSATVGKPEKLKEYLREISGRDFVLASTEERPTEQVFLGEISPAEAKSEGLTPSIVFFFSYRGVEATAGWLAGEFGKGEQSHLVRDIASRYRINDDRLVWMAERGVVVYHGGLLYKEKKFAEEVARQGLADFIVGTDALSLGVNLPARSVIFGQLARYYDGPISKREFLQMAGRAGRYGLYSRGYVGWYHSPFEAWDYDTGDLWDGLMESEVEAGMLSLTPDIGAIIRGETTTEDEASYISSFSVDLETGRKLFTEEYATYTIKSTLRVIDDFLDECFGGEDKGKSYLQVLGDIYFSEYSVHTNISLAYRLFSRGEIDVEDIVFIEGLDGVDGKRMYDILQLRKFLKRVKALGYKVVNLKKLEKKIREIDHLVLG